MIACYIYNLLNSVAQMETIGSTIQKAIQ